MSNEATGILDDLLKTLQSKLDSRDADTERDDAITAVLRSEPRATAVTSLREAPQVEAFRQALIDGLIRVDTANKLLSLINEVIVRLVP